MTKLLNNNKFFSKRKQTPNQKLLVTISILCLYRFCNTIPLSGIDNLALKESFLQFEKNNSIVQILNMYSGGGGKTVLSPFSLGIIPFINASILIDLLTNINKRQHKIRLFDFYRLRRQSHIQAFMS